MKAGREGAGVGIGRGDAPPARDGLRILCVEDNDGDFLLLRENLREAEFISSPILERAVSLGDALSVLEKDPAGFPDFDVILLDLSLPDSYGPGTLERITAVAEKVPVIILSGNEDRELAVEMVQRGAQDYLPKNSLGGDLLMRSILYAQERQRSRLALSAANVRLREATEELKTAQMQLIQAEKLDSLGRLAAGVAHEVKNPLATLQMGVDYFGRKVEAFGDSGKTMIECMQHAISSADRIIRGMVDYSRSDALNLKRCDINQTMRRALRMIKHEFVKNSVTVERRLTKPIPMVRIDEGKLEQVLINLLINGIQAMGDIEGERLLSVGTAWGRVEAIERDLGLRDFDRLRARDNAVVVEIRDRGGGIREDKLTRVFEPFFTTKPTGQGTGLGLSVAKNIIDLHRGHIQVSNAENPRGLRVRIILKAYELTDEIEKLSPPTPLPFTKPKAAQ